MAIITRRCKVCDICGISDDEIEPYMNANIETHYFRLNSYNFNYHGSIQQDKSSIDLCPKCEKMIYNLLKEKCKK